MTEIEIINKSHHNLPQYETSFSSGMDIKAFIDSPILLKSLQRCMVPTGLYVAIPENYEIQIRPRSGLAWKNGVTVINTPGTIDADYRGELKIVLINHSTEDFLIQDGDRIAQMVLQKVEKISWSEKKELNETQRGEGGFGHSGIQ